MIHIKVLFFCLGIVIVIICVGFATNWFKGSAIPPRPGPSPSPSPAPAAPAPSPAPSQQPTDNNCHEWNCPMDSLTFQTYDWPSLDKDQKDWLNKTYDNPNPKSISCVQGCTGKGECKKGGFNKLTTAGIGCNPSGKHIPTSDYSTGRF